MYTDYKDIRDRIAEPPKWWDEEAVPRYCAFAPNEAADIYADEAALVLIACQACGHEFPVAFTESQSSLTMYEAMYGQPYSSLAERIRVGSIHYGDPPNIGCCTVGATMNCIDLRVLEYWTKHGSAWQRNPSLEIALPDESPTDQGA